MSTQAVTVPQVHLKSPCEGFCDPENKYFIFINLHCKAGVVPVVCKPNVCEDTLCAMTGDASSFNYFDDVGRSVAAGSALDAVARELEHMDGPDQAFDRIFNVNGSNLNIPALLVPSPSHPPLNLGESRGDADDPHGVPEFLGQLTPTI
jgi:hypothetical protein